MRKPALGYLSVYKWKLFDMSAAHGYTIGGGDLVKVFIEKFSGGFIPTFHTFDLSKWDWFSKEWRP